MGMLNIYHDESKKDQLVTDAQKYGPLRTNLALNVIPVLNENEWTKGRWFLEGGTLLGAWRNQKMIPHDDDFDIAIWPTIPEGVSETTLLKELVDQLTKLSFNARLVDDYNYVLKIEVFDPSYGKFELKPGVDFHNVSVDITLFTGNEKAESTHYSNLGKFIPREFIFPTTKILYEGFEFSAPNNTEEFLKIHYGYLGRDAIYNPKTTLYEKRET